TTNIYFKASLQNRHSHDNAPALLPAYGAGVRCLDLTAPRGAHPEHTAPNRSPACERQLPKDQEQVSGRACTECTRGNETRLKGQARRLDHDIASGIG